MFKSEIYLFGIRKFQINITTVFNKCEFSNFCFNLILGFSKISDWQEQ